jgi:2-amino-4-hydroxy-6-hydroxymethyldihydropteridine diphosphokinase
MAHQVIIALGSNNRQNAHIQWASQRMALLLEQTSFSKILWTKDVKGSGRLYMNRLVAGYTELAVDDVEQILKSYEAESHRTPDQITIDLDLMLYDGNPYHLRDWPRPYISLLISELPFTEEPLIDATKRK